MARVSLLLLLAAALLVHQLLHGAAGSPVQLELLRFLNPQAPTLSRLAAAAASQQRQAPPAAQQPAGAGRSLLQDGDGPTFVEGPGACARTHTHAAAAHACMVARARVGARPQPTLDTALPCLGGALLRNRAQATRWMALTLALAASCPSAARSTALASRSTTSCL